MLKILCLIGFHVRVLEGGGGMGDGLTCVDCGADWYPAAFRLPRIYRQWPSGQMIDRTPKGRAAAWEEAGERQDFGVTP